MILGQKKTLSHSLISAGRDGGGYGESDGGGWGGFSGSDSSGTGLGPAGGMAGGSGGFGDSIANLSGFDFSLSDEETQNPQNDFTGAWSAADVEAVGKAIDSINKEGIATHDLSLTNQVNSFNTRSNAIREVITKGIDILGTLGLNKSPVGMLTGKVAKGFLGPKSTESSVKDVLGSYKSRGSVAANDISITGDESNAGLTGNYGPASERAAGQPADLLSPITSGQDGTGTTGEGSTVESPNTGGDILGTTSFQQAKSDLDTFKFRLGSNVIETTPRSERDLLEKLMSYEVAKKNADTNRRNVNSNTAATRAQIDALEPSSIDKIGQIAGAFGDIYGMGTVISGSDSWISDAISGWFD